MIKKKEILIEVANPHAAGIDVGSRSHYVAVGEGKDQVREFGVYSEDHQKMTDWLHENGIETVAMESTGTYWQTLYSALVCAGFRVILCNGKYTKNPNGSKTDVKDGRHIQRLHMLGLLTGSFLPDAATEEVRTYCRQRDTVQDQASDSIRRMQKYLRLLNLRLDIVVRDISGETGQNIIKAVCAGEMDSQHLASLRNGNCKHSEEEIAKALQCNGRKDYLFGLKQEYELYQYLRAQIESCDRAIKQVIETQINSDDHRREHYIEKKPHKKINKNTPKNMDLNLLGYQYFEGVDLMAIEGVSHSTVLTLMSEIGACGVKKFATAKHFCSWLRLSPNNRVSGGRILSSHIPKGSNRLKVALRNAANAIGNMRGTPLSDFFHRINCRKGHTAAVSATARKLAVIIWNMLVKKQPYNHSHDYEYLDQKRKRKVLEAKKLIKKFEIKAEELCLNINAL
jgi:transposase